MIGLDKLPVVCRATILGGWGHSIVPETLATPLPVNVAEQGPRITAEEAEDQASDVSQFQRKSRLPQSHRCLLDNKLKAKGPLFKDVQEWV